MALAFPAASSAPASSAPASEGALFAQLAPWTPLALALALMALGAFAPQVLNDGDTFWHIAAGQWTLAHGGAPHADPFSYTYAGTPWIAHEWLAEVMMASAYAGAGLRGVTALTGLAVGMAFYALARAVGRDLRGPAIFAVLGVAALILAPSLLARPHILALPVSVWWILALVRAQAAGKAPSLWALPLMMLWANMHGGFVFGLALIAPFGLEALLDAPDARRMDLAMRWTLFSVLSVGAALLTPNGIEGLLFPFALANNPNMAAVIEWRPEQLTQFGPFEWALVGLLGVGFWRGLALRAIPAALIVGLTFMTLQHTRHALLFALVAPPLLARPLGAAFGEAKADAPPAAQKRADFAFIVGAVALIAARLVMPLALHDTKPTPVSALAAVPADLRAKPVFNSLADGGFLILSGVKPFIDGRFDMYPKAHVDDYLAASAGEPGAARRVLDAHAVAWTILQPGAKLADWLDHEPEWRRLYADSTAIIYAREDLPLRGTE